MGIIINIIIGIIATVLGSLLVYVYKTGQLYLVVPRLFLHTNITNIGKIVEFDILNKGNYVEENIRIELDPSFKYEIVGATIPNIAIDKSVVLINRVQKRSEISLIILVENGDFSKDKVVSISSSKTKGVIVESLEGILPNYGTILSYSIAVMLYLLLIFNIDSAMNFYDSYKIKNSMISLKEISDSGWENIEKYSVSELRKSYINGFPVYIENGVRKEDIVVGKIKLINETSAEMKFSINVKNPSEFEEDDLNHVKRYLKNHINKTLPPKTTNEYDYEIYVPKDKNVNDVFFNVWITSGEEMFYNIKKGLKLAPKD